jgi:hypothetical protein
VPLAGKGSRWTMPAPWVAADDLVQFIDSLMSTLTLHMTVSIISRLKLLFICGL